jgi:hypothetical protein
MGSEFSKNCKRFRLPFAFLKHLGLLQRVKRQSANPAFPQFKLESKPTKMTKPTSPLSALARSAMDEFIAMALFVWVGCGSAVSSQALQVFQKNPIDSPFL